MGTGALLECLKVSKKLLQYHYLQSLHSTLLCKVANIEIVLFKIHKYSRMYVYIVSFVQKSLVRVVV